MSIWSVLEPKQESHAVYQGSLTTLEIKKLTLVKLDYEHIISKTTKKIDTCEKTKTPDQF